MLHVLINFPNQPNKEPEICHLLEKLICEYLVSLSDRSLSFAFAPSAASQGGRMPKSANLRPTGRRSNDKKLSSRRRS